jgi:hypothetical protein
MRRALTALLVAFALWPVPAALAKFGITKTHVLLPRLRPPENPPMARTVAVDVRSRTPEVTGSHVSLVQERLQDAFHEGGGSPYRLVERAREADAVIGVSLERMSAEVRDEIRIETRYVKVGERDKWNEKKKKYEKEDIYANRDFHVSWRIAEGSLSASMEVEGGGSDDISTSYREEFKEGGRIPPEATTEESLRRFLVRNVAERAVGVVAYSADPVEALLAVNGELKAGNKFAEAGLWEDALREWTRKRYKGDTEAARMHNEGVAHEALAYRLPPHAPQHREHLESARGLYRAAMALDPDEKFFRDPPVRIEASLGYADRGTRFMTDVTRFQEEAEKRRQARNAAPVAVPAVVKDPPAATTAKTKAPQKPAPGAAKPAPPAKPSPKAEPAASGSAALSGSAAVQSPLRNGSFESALASWALAGKGEVVDEARRGRVLEMAGNAGAASVAQAVDVPMADGNGATLSLDYKVTAGEGEIKATLAYADANGKDRTAALPVTAGEGPGGWSPWTADVAALRPRPARVKEVRIVVEGGTVRLDNVALTVK